MSVFQNYDIVLLGWGAHCTILEQVLNAFLDDRKLSEGFLGPQTSGIEFIIFGIWVF